MPRKEPARPWRNWYGTKRWVERSRYQLRSHPLCKSCLEHGLVVAAQVADHIIPHRGDAQLFWFGELQSLCGSCHSSSKAQIETKGFIRDIGVDGWPVDEGHPVYRTG